MTIKPTLLAIASLLGLLLMGAAPPPAPVVTTKGFYVNDYAAVLFDTHRDDMFTLSTRLYEQTGVQVVLLTVDDLMGYEIDTYAGSIIHDWEIGGPGNADGIFILVSTGEHAAGVYMGSAIDYLEQYRSAEIEVGGNNISKAIMNVYKPMVADIYAHHQITPDKSTLDLLENPQEESSGPFTTGTVIFLAVVLLAMGRSLRTSRKYKSKYLKGNVRKLRDHTRANDKEDAYQEQKYRIDDDRD